jgi:hypothetical protein
MSDIATYCAVSGLCYNLASDFLMKIPWQNVMKDLVLNSGKKVWSSRNSFKLVLKEAQMSQQIFNHFATTIERLEEYQKTINVPICSLVSATLFIKDFEKVLELYDPKNLNDWEKNTAGDTLRQQLQYYISYMHSIMGNIHLELSYVTLQLQTIQMEKDPMRRSNLIKNLKKGCSKRLKKANESYETFEQSHTNTNSTTNTDIRHQGDDDNDDEDDTDDGDSYSDVSDGIDDFM